MPAHLRSIVETCQQPRCNKTATVQLYNTFNARIGTFCRRHGEEALRELQRLISSREDN